MTYTFAVSETYWPHGGAELATHLTLKILASSDKNMKINVLTGCRKPERASGIDHIYSPALNTPDQIRLWKNLLVLRRLRWFRREIQKADVVYIPRIAYPIIPIAKRYRKKVVVHLHDYQPIDFQSMILYPYEKTFETGVFNSMKHSFALEMLEHGDLKRALASSILSPINTLSLLWLSQADKVICVSEKQAEIIRREMPEISDKIRVIYNPIPRIPFTEKKFHKRSPVNILYLGGHYYSKGFHVFLRVSQKLLERDFDVKFLLTREFKSTAKKLLVKVLGGTCNLLGYVKNEDVFKIHRIGRALMFPSITEEPFPYAVLESMLSGTVPVASNVGGVPEIVEGSFAEKMLFNPYNITECVSRLEHLLTMSNEQIKDVGFSLRETVLKKFNSTATRKKLVDVFLS